ncbi:MAG: branched-chain amino acid ABC transporter permease, partial [Desulfobacteraceae bacterium]|nr:branched-chain amino acid ABC transporter permease [Desulfobacteraceae bacterium]
FIGLPFWVAFILAIVLSGLVSLVIYYFSFDLLKGAPLLIPLVSTLGFSILLQNAAGLIWGTERQAFPESISSSIVYFGPIGISPAQIAIFAVGILLMISLDQFIQKTRIGRGMRAVAENPGTANILGINSRWVIITTFFASGVLAGASGVLFSISYFIVEPLIGFHAGIKAIAAMIVGGLGNVRGAIAGGFFIGFIEIMSMHFLGSEFRDIIVYALIFAALIILPQGLMGVVKQEKGRI